MTSKAKALISRRAAQRQHAHYLATRERDEQRQARWLLALVLHRVDGLTMRAIGRQLGVGHAMAATMVNRGERALKRLAVTPHAVDDLAHIADTEALMRQRDYTWTTANGRVILTIPTPVDTETVAELEQLFALVIQQLRRKQPIADAADAVSGD